MALTTDDITAIQQLYGLYCHAIDDGDGKTFSSCFTPDGYLGGVGKPLVGTEKLAQFAERTGNSGMGLRHVAAGIYVDGDGDDAQGRAYLVAYNGGDAAKFRASGRYRDRLRRVDGKWLFVERRFTPDGGPSAV